MSYGIYEKPMATRMRDQPKPAGFKRAIERLAYRRDEAATALGVSMTKFADWERRGLVPKAVKIDGVTLYDAQQLAIAWACMRDGQQAEFDNGNPYDSE